MDLETARVSIGKWVTYDDDRGVAEEGVISSVTERVVFVRFEGGVKACPFASLTLLAGHADGKPPARWEPRLAAHATGAAPFKFARAGVPDGAALIAAERRRQIAGEGWTAEHDAGHGDGELTRAAICYATPAHRRITRGRAAQVSADRGSWYEDVPDEWPWHPAHWKPSPDRIRELAKAGALIAAEIDRLLAIGEVPADGS